VAETGSPPHYDMRDIVGPHRPSGRHTRHSPFVRFLVQLSARSGLGPQDLVLRDVTIGTLSQPAGARESDRDSLFGMTSPSQPSPTPRLLARMRARMRTCPKCLTKVLPSEDGLCPACRGFVFHASPFAEGHSRDMQTEERAQSLWAYAGIATVVGIASLPALLVTFFLAFLAAGGGWGGGPAIFAWMLVACFGVRTQSAILAATSSTVAAMAGGLLVASAWEDLGVAAFVLGAAAGAFAGLCAGRGRRSTPDQAGRDTSPLPRQ
jgi:hypothetical protein